MPKCATSECLDDRKPGAAFCAACYAIEAIKSRWDRWVDWHPRAKRIAVHPSDWQIMGFPAQYRGLAVKALGFEEWTSCAQQP